MKSLITTILFTLTIFFLHGCAAPSSNIEPTKENTYTTPSDLSPEQLIQKAFSSPDDNIKISSYLEAAQKYYQNHLVAQSSAILRNIDADKISPEHTTKALLLNLQLGINEDIEWHVLNSTLLFKPELLSQTNIEDLKRIIPLLAKAYRKLDEDILSAILLIEYSGIFDSLDYSEANETIWSTLRASNPIELVNFKYQGNDKDVIAWLELVRAIQQNQISLENQYMAFSQWKEKWANHPAALTPPKELILLAQLPETKPVKLILALPFSGPVASVGNAIRDGLMAAYFDNPNPSSPPMTITYFDTNKHPIESLYANSPEENALVIGPLTKTNVNKLNNLDLSSTPTLALNYLETQPNTPSNQKENLYQFGLNPESEIEQLSRLLEKKGHHKVAFIAPENELGFRIQDSLLQALHSHKSMIIESVFYQDQKSLSPTVAKLLATDLSYQRKNKLQQITSLNMEFEPRRRNDIDAIYMLAKPEIAKQLNPLFAYHYARELPIYSSSQIHQINKPQNDLDNILFLEMPWMLSNSIKIKKEINNSIPSAENEYTRFYALGADAFSLSTRLKLLKEIQNTQLQGQTGVLSIDNVGIVHRQLELATFKKGRAVAIKE